MLPNIIVAAFLPVAAESFGKSNVRQSLVSLSRKSTPPGSLKPRLSWRKVLIGCEPPTSMTRDPRIMDSPKPVRPVILAAALGLWLAACASDAQSDAVAGFPAPCSTVGAWVDPASGLGLGHDDVIASQAERPVVLLGESHHDRRHHRWQLHTIAALQGHRPDMVLGFEMFPRKAQPVLDRWVAGELTTEAFLREVDWAEIWGFDADLYLPLFHFARQHRVPMVALNVDRALVAWVGREGWDAVPAKDREGVSDPAPASEAYRRSLARVYAMKHQHAARTTGTQPSPTEPSAEDLAEIFEDPDFRRFVEAQLTWDRAMAEALARARRSGGNPLVVGIVGRGHAEHGWGIPRQLDALGIPDTAVLLPVDRAEDCGVVAPGVADAVFIVEEMDEPARPRPRLGIRIEATDAGVRVGQVMQGSVAEAAGIRAGDIIVAAAGFPVKKAGDLIEIVDRQAPGTWLPVAIRRHGKPREVIARFPGGGDADR